MRKIKFRVWHKYDKYMEQDHDIELLTPIEKENHARIVMQFIGIYDGYLKEVYEDDIVSFKCNHCDADHSGVIVWMKDFCCYGIKTENQTAPLIVPAMNQFEQVGVALLSIQKVLGNIHENPEFLLCN